MKNYVIISVFALFFLYSCGGCRESDWAELVVPSEAELVFVNTSQLDPYYSKVIAVPMDENFEDTLFVYSHNLVQKVCYYRLTNPDNDIKLEYLSRKEKNRRSYEVRFVRLVEND